MKKEDEDEGFDELFNLLDKIDFGKNEEVDDKYLDNVPLFMDDDSLPEDWDKIDNLVAIKKLQEDETPEQILEEYKHEGNQSMLKGKKMNLTQAVVFYTKAIHAKAEDKIKLSLVYSNRAMAHLKLGKKKKKNTKKKKTKSLIQ